MFFIDYGTVAKVPIKGICYLHRKFAVMPQQAIRGRLAGVFPPYAQQQWPREISTRFYGLVAKKELVARIQKINLQVNHYTLIIHLKYFSLCFIFLLQKQVVHLCLYEPPPIGSPDPPIDINGVLLNEGYAVSSPEVNDLYNSSNSSVISESDSSTTVNTSKKSNATLLTTKEVLSKIENYRKSQ